jgi:hypothetical protein
MLLAATIVKLIKEAIPNARVAGDATDMILACCTGIPTKTRLTHKEKRGKGRGR